MFADEEIGLEPIEFHDAVQWLKVCVLMVCFNVSVVHVSSLQASPDPQPDLISRWHSYLMESIERAKIRARSMAVGHSSTGRAGKDYSKDVLEKRWQEIRRREEGPPLERDEEVLRYWEGYLSEYNGEASFPIYWY
jgi:hypothetical protein